MPDPLDARQHSPATLRNREPILAVLQAVLPPTGTVLEISSGTGEHAVFFAPRLQPRYWLPSDPNPIARASIAAWQEELSTDNLHPPIFLDVRDPVWTVEQPEMDLSEPIRAIANINMIHISPWAACLGLMAAAERILPQGGVLYLYGPFKQSGEHTAPSNAQFDQSLRLQNPEWGVRDLEEVIAVAEAHNMRLLQTVAMPANNLSVVFQRL
ncbi:MAG: SAM-dependent methyltransferase [Leptolyngbya sp.]|nr:MAG: SAM-dependent methyltransferase [Leptolyngbya sp.]